MLSWLLKSLYIGVPGKDATFTWTHVCCGGTTYIISLVRSKVTRQDVPIWNVQGNRIIIL